MTFNEQCAALQEKLINLIDDDDNRRQTAAEWMGSFFSVHPHEIGLFALDEKQRKLLFRWPRTLAQKTEIPLSMTHSLVVRTVREAKSRIDNAFAATRHLNMVEHLLAEKEERMPVQKVMSVPIIDNNGSVVGAIQVTRKGLNAAAAGPDFTPQDLSSLESFAAIFRGVPV